MAARADVEAARADGRRGDRNRSLVRWLRRMQAWTAADLRYGCTLERFADAGDLVDATIRSPTAAISSSTTSC